VETIFSRGLGALVAFIFDAGWCHMHSHCGFGHSATVYLQSVLFTETFVFDYTVF